MKTAKYTQKKNCNGCKALYGIGIDQRCLIGYKMTTTQEKHEHYTYERAIPLEPCPKPKTHKEKRECDWK